MAAVSQGRQPRRHREFLWLSLKAPMADGEVGEVARMEAGCSRLLTEETETAGWGPFPPQSAGLGLELARHAPVFLQSPSVFSLQESCTQRGVRSILVLF